MSVPVSNLIRSPSQLPTFLSCALLLTFPLEMDYGNTQAFQEISSIYLQGFALFQWFRKSYLSEDHALI